MVGFAAISASIYSQQAPAPEQVDTVPAAAQVAEEPPPAGATRVLPAGLDANPPKPEELAQSGMTWKGEYETDATGKVLLGPDALPLPVLYNKKGKRVKSKVKMMKTHPITIANGTLTVDGWAGKAQLNYDVPDMQFLYFSSPSIGTVVVSQVPFPGSKEQKNGFDGQTLTVEVDGHEVQLASDKAMLKSKAASAYVKYDPDFTQDAQYPVMGFGSVVARPYAWPNAKGARVQGAAGDAPPLPASLRPKMATPVCIAQAGHPCGAVQPAAAAPRPAAPANAAARPVPGGTAEAEVKSTATATPKVQQATPPAAAAAPAP